MKYIYCPEYMEHIRTLISQDIIRFGLVSEKSSKENSLKVKKSKSKDFLNVTCNAVFGNSLCSQPKVMVDDCGCVPRFLVDSVAALEKHMHVEGLFRKTGSLARQREYKGRIDGGESVDDTCSPLDICCLIKQFLRELPNPLMTFELHNMFMSSFIQLKEDREKCLSVILNLLASQSHANKMDASNLAICLAPNILYSLDSFKGKKTNLSYTPMTPARQRSSDSALGAFSLGTEATIQAETEIIRLLIENSNKIGEVSENMYKRAASFAMSLSSLDAEEVETQEIGCSGNKKIKMKKRGGSLQGLVSNLGSSFTRWLNNRSSLQDQSLNNPEKSSIISMDDSTFHGSVDSCKNEARVPSFCGQDEMDLEEMMKISKMQHTPKIMMNSASKKPWKRKATDDYFTPTLGFSATKRKALLETLPQNGVLGTTPLSRLLKQSNISDGPGILKDGDNLDSECKPSSANRSFNVKLKRVASMRRTNGISPKSTKTNVKMKLRGLLRRLSGNKDKNHERKQHKDFSKENFKGAPMFSNPPMISSPAPALKNPFQDVLDLQDEKLDSFLFCDVDCLDFTRAWGPSQGFDGDDRCRDLKRIREQRGIEGLHGLQFRTTRECSNEMHFSSKGTEDDCLLREDSKRIGKCEFSPEGFVEDGDCSNVSGTILRRGRPNTIKNGLKHNSLQGESKMNILGTSPINSPFMKFRNVREDVISVSNFGDERDPDETVIKVLDVAFTEDDLHSVVCGSLTEESSLLKIGQVLPSNEELIKAGNLNDFNLYANETGAKGLDCVSHFESLNSSIEKVEYPADKVAELAIQEPCRSKSKLSPRGLETFIKQSSSMPEMYSLSDDLISIPKANQTEKNYEVTKGSSDQAICNIDPSLIKCSEVTSDAQNIITQSENINSRCDELEDECAEKALKSNSTESDSIATQKQQPGSADPDASSRKVAKLAVSNFPNCTAFGSRNNVPSITQSDDKGAVYTGDVKENHISHLPPPSPFKPRRLLEPLVAFQQVQEESRTARKPSSPTETDKTSQPKIRAPLIASSVAKYLAAVQASSSSSSATAGRDPSPRKLRSSPLKAVKRLQQASSPKAVKAVGAKRPHGSPAKPNADQGQSSDSCTIKFDLEV